MSSPSPISTPTTNGQKNAKDYPLLDITVSDYLEKNATPQQREMGADLANWVVENEPF